MSNETQTKRRGRPAGSNSFIKLRLSDLIRIVGEGAVVPVSKVWLRENGIDSAEKPVTISIAPAEEPQEQETKIEFKFTKFED